MIPEELNPLCLIPDQGEDYYTADEFHYDYYRDNLYPFEEEDGNEYVTGHYFRK